MVALGVVYDRPYTPRAILSAFPRLRGGHVDHGPSAPFGLVQTIGFASRARRSPNRRVGARAKLAGQTRRAPEREFAWRRFGGAVRFRRTGGLVTRTVLCGGRRCVAMPREIPIPEHDDCHRRHRQTRQHEELLPPRVGTPRRRAGFSGALASALTHFRLQLPGRSDGRRNPGRRYRGTLDAAKRAHPRSRTLQNGSRPVADTCSFVYYSARTGSPSDLRTFLCIVLL